MFFGVGASGRQRVRHRQPMTWLEDHDRGRLEQRNLQTPALVRAAGFDGIYSQTIENLGGMPQMTFVASNVPGFLNAPLGTEFHWTAAGTPPPEASDTTNVSNSLGDAITNDPGTTGFVISADLTHFDSVTTPAHGGMSLSHSSAARTGNVASGAVPLTWDVIDSPAGTPYVGSLIAQGTLKIVWGPPTAPVSTVTDLGFHFDATIGPFDEVRADLTGGTNLTYDYTTNVGGKPVQVAGVMNGFFDRTGNGSSTIFTFSVPVTTAGGLMQTVDYNIHMTTSYNVGAQSGSGARTDLQFQFNLAYS